MNVLLVFCAIIAAPEVIPVSADTADSVTPTWQNLPVQPISPQPSRPPQNHARPSYPQSTAMRPARAMSEGVQRPSRMPFAPTDPRALARTDLPQPPTMNDSGMLPTAGRIGMGPRNETAGQAENGSRRLTSQMTNQKPFENYRSSPALSPYLMLDNPTNNGTISNYMAYVRPAEEDQERANQGFDGGTSGLANPSNQPAPTYPPAFLNYGGYYPAYAAGR